MNDWQGRLIQANGLDFHVVVRGSGPLVLLVHGWPELGYSWRHQVAALSEAGYTVAAPDVRGYGRSEKPEAVHDYSMINMCTDMAALVDALGGGESAVIVGHDWGAPIAWTTAILHPDKIRAVAALSVPYTGRGEISSTRLWQQVYKDRFFYQNYFQAEGVAEAEFEADMRTALRKVFYSGSGEAIGGQVNSEAMAAKGPDSNMLDGLVDPDPFPAWLSEAELDFYVEQFEAGGMRGPLNRYRCQNLDWEELPQLSELKVRQPAAFIAGSLEPVLSFVPDVDMVEIMKRQWVPDLRLSRIIDGAGHWIQQERPAEVNSALLEFLQGLD
ncbi:MAG: alpha/beta hydrolase [Gammaproteobacteria bacterium AqS3]|nr:alpha/beta hydrolase [Gammaproteobacteria bacterium AqS3]